MMRTPLGFWPLLAVMPLLSPACDGGSPCAAAAIARCNGTVIQQCNTSLKWADVLDCTASGRACREGVCVDITDASAGDSAAPSDLRAASDMTLRRCRCDDVGVTFEPKAGCMGWPDATKCSGWQSAYCGERCEPSDMKPPVDMAGQNCVRDCEAPFTSMNPPTFEDGETHTAYGCTITIHCP